jgi:localization factor PodJL
MEEYLPGEVRIRTGRINVEASEHMNGSRSAPPRHGDRDRSSLDALNRTIEGLEARIQGLMAGVGRPAPPRMADDERIRAPQQTAAYTPAPSPAPAPQRPPITAQPRSAPLAPLPRDPLAEIRERQRILEQASQRAQAIETPRHETPRHEPPAAEVSRFAEGRVATPTRREDLRQPAIATRVAEASQRRADLREFTDALTNLRQDLKRDISDGLTHEMQALREEVRAIKTQAQDPRFAEDVHADLTRLSQSIDHLTAMQATPDAGKLRADFDDLRSVMDGLAREESLRQMQDQWVGLEERIQETDTVSALREELVTLAYRIDDIRNQLGLMADSPVIRALEQKLLAVAGMMEQLGAKMKPSDAALIEQFGQLDQRLDEITRAIAANAVTARTASSAQDELAMQRLEGGLSALMEHVETIGRSASDRSATDGLSLRIELLAGKIEDLADEQTTKGLEQRIEQLSALVLELQPTGQQDEFAGYLSDISRKIDALDSNFTAEGLGDRLDYLSRRIEEMEVQPKPRDGADEAAFGRIEDRLSDIAARLDEATNAPRGDDDALRGLEAQIAHLSTLISEPSNTAPVAWPPEFDHRMAAIEGYMATNDEYIVEAARQAAETVVEAYSRNLSAGSGVSGSDMAALAALADDLKSLEDLTRGSESRTHQTFEALHGTLVQIADRLDQLEGHVTTAASAMPYRAEEPVRQPAFASAPIHREVSMVREAAPSAMPALSAEVAHELANIDMPRTEARLRETSAIGSTMGDHIPAMLKPAEADVEIDEKPARKSLLGGLARRFRPAAKQKNETAARTYVEPTPSIDPSAEPDDMLSPESENELLEPGSGAPDVKKILERVRASQAAGEFGGDRTGDRADYIAAARRAAKAAAQEADPSQMGSMPKGQAKAIKPQPGKDTKGDAKGATKGISAFSRHRRPILMAVGAILLALMAMPLIKTVTGGNSAPQVASIERPAAPVGASSANIPASPAPAIAPQATQAQNTTAPIAGSASDLAASPAMPADNSVTSAPLGAPATGSETDVVADAPAADGDGTLPAATPDVAQQGQAAGGIDVPAAIEPQSLAHAASTGDANALFEIGARYSEGRGVTTDMAEAAKWYRLAADRGLPPAQYRMGNILEKGTGVERNINAAISYYQQAAQAGNASSMHNLAVLYASGTAGQPDYAKAIDWFRKAAELGVADSQFNLAILYARGNGVKQDLEESYKWFGVAAKGGDTDAAAKRDEVAKAMRKDQLDSAKAKLDAWAAKPLDPRANAVNLPDEWAAGKPLTTSSIDMTKAIRNIQAILNKNGFDAGTPDGKMGAKTVTAIKAFQTSIGHEPTGKVDDAMVRELLKRNG